VGNLKSEDWVNLRVVVDLG